MDACVRKRKFAPVGYGLMTVVADVLVMFTYFETFDATDLSM